MEIVELLPLKVCPVEKGGRAFQIRVITLGANINVLQGSHIWSKLRPVDQLRQLLIDCQGPDAEEVKAFFLRLHKVVH